MSNLATLIRRSSQWYRNSVAVIDGNRQLSFQEIGDRSNRLANTLGGLSQEPQSRIALLLHNQLEFIEADLAIIKAGKVRIAINPRLTEREIEFILTNSEAETLICNHEDQALAHSLRQKVPSLKNLILVGGIGTNSIAYEDAILAGKPSWQPQPASVDAPSMIFYTSGTTGQPKGAVWSNASRLGAITNMLIDELQPTTKSTMLHLASLSHGSGSKVLPFFIRGGCNVILPRFEPDMFIKQATAVGATHTFMVPTMIKMALESAAKEIEPLNWSMESITYGGAPMPIDLLKQALDRFGPIFVQVYGASEAPHPITILTRNEHLPRYANDKRISSAGRESTLVEVRLVDQNGIESDTGELWVAGPNVMTGYWRNQIATQAAFSDGFYKTGDVARRDEDGYLYIIDRVRDMIISGGFNVYPAEVEAVLREHPAVRDVSVIGVDDAIWGEKVIAIIVPNSAIGLSEEELTNFCRNALANYKIPKSFFIQDELPLGSTGKVLKSVLREQFGK